ncbi:MAG: DNA polymerase II [Alteromonadaceae bacterium]|uniref:DNA polymerase II n=1 Tax=Paraglaciecola chathamensis TaxID=368405 RepID=UPI000C53D99F|nr:DNA polymerase II [Paraglaciecola agarilytica]MBN23894.1 DNA polymerase II [Alteromonadaceae bacterium]|tara:strand:+ start:43743 stop:46100 length:2358 start_codon:yes stop_codon:yes gene_type:complete
MGNSNRGFILTSDLREISGQTCLEFWLSSADGPIKVTTTPQQGVFFISQQDAAQAKDILATSQISCQINALALKRFDQQPVSALYFSRAKQVYAAKERLRVHGITCYEADIRLADRYLMERFIYASVDFRGTKQNTAKYPNYTQSQLKPGQYTPSFSVLSIDIECSEKGELYSIGFASSTYQAVFMIGDNQQCPDFIQWVADEKALLQCFIAAIQTQDPDIIIGWNVVNFDFRLLIERAQLYNLKLTLGRGGEAVYWRDAPNEVNQGYISMPGRVVIDGIDALKTATYQFASFSLEFVAQALLGKGKLSDDVDDRLAKIKHDFVHNKVKLAQYNLQDCQLVLEIFEHTKMLDFLTLRSQLTGLELNRVGGSVAAFVNLYLPKLHRAGYISPNRPVDGGLASPGGYVMTSTPGLYRNVLVLDFKSLYPSIIRTFKIDPLGLVEGLRAPNDGIQGFKGAVFSREQHFLPDIITSLWQQRDTAKRDKDAARSQAIKILMNSFYGVLGSGGCPFYDTRLASSITLRGHEIMQTTATWVESMGYKVIYGDTDSIFVWLGDEMQAQQGFEVGLQLQQSINQRWHEQIAEQHQVENFLEIEFETQFNRFLMPTIRGSELGSKKRYAGLKRRQGEEDELVFKGLESVRSDWTPMAKTFQLALYQKVFTGQEVSAYIQQFVAQIRTGELDEHLVYRKRIRRPLAQYVKNIPPHVKAARLADEQNEQLGKPLRYQHKGQIAYVITLNGAQPIEYQSCSLDYEHYIEKQIKPIAESILPFIGVSFTDITSAQLGLF